jgi:16S rRNA (guanine(1405)-N(7))-methyltransferase
MTLDETQVTAVVTAVKQSKKYADTSEATIRALAADALRRYKKPKPAIKAVRAQLHSIMAPYLGDPDYEAAKGRLTAVFATADPTQIKAACADILHAHLSTRERLPLLDSFYREIFAVTGPPASLLDIACGLNPLAFPWMDLPPAATQFHAYDIHEPRIDFLNHYFRLQGLPPLARVQDVAHTFPQEAADVALFLKEMPRFARNYGDLGRPLLEALNVRWLVVSFPAVSTHGGRNLTNRYREFMAQLIANHPWPTTELLFEGELVFCIDKGEG